MPELPEVETVKCGLNAILPLPIELGRVGISDKQLRFDYPEGFAKLLKGKMCSGVSRRAKYLIFDLGEHLLLSHLGMTGSWRSEDGDAFVPLKHDHFWFQYWGHSSPSKPFEATAKKKISPDRKTGRASNYKKVLVYNDPRRFGYLGLIPKQNWKEHKWFAHLGPEPLGREFSKKYFFDGLQAGRMAVKPFIMKQEVVVGVGNIYASEALHRAKIHPLTLCYQLSQLQSESLRQAIKLTLKKAIRAGGSSIIDFKNAEGDRGYFQAQFKVYGRAKKPCLTCKEVAIQSDIVGGRSTFWCPSCQSRPADILNDA